MKLILERQHLGQRFTEGKLRIQGTTFSCDTLEPPYVPIRTRFDKLPDGTAIPYGNYEVRITYSPKFHAKRPLLVNVPFFEGVRIHEGNSVADTTGCILVGVKDRPGHIYLSRVTLHRLLNSLLLTSPQELVTLSVTANVI